MKRRRVVYVKQRESLVWLALKLWFVWVFVLPAICLVGWIVVAAISMWTK